MKKIYFVNGQWIDVNDSMVAGIQAAIDMGKSFIISQDDNGVLNVIINLNNITYITDASNPVYNQ